MTGWENLHPAPGCARASRSPSLAGHELTSQPRPVTIKRRVMRGASEAKLAEPKFGLTEHRFEASTSSGDVSALLMRPLGADCLLVLAHGAGAGMRHPFMEALAVRLADLRIATFRYQFPYDRERTSAPRLSTHSAQDRPVGGGCGLGSLGRASPFCGGQVAGWPNDVLGRFQGCPLHDSRHRLLWLSPPSCPEARH